MTVAASTGKKPGLPSDVATERHFAAHLIVPAKLDALIGFALATVERPHPSPETDTQLHLGSELIIAYEVDVVVRITLIYPQSLHRRGEIASGGYFIAHLVAHSQRGT